MTQENDNPKKRRTVELVRSTYHPTKREKEMDGIPPLSDDAPEDITERMEMLGQAITEPVDIRWIDKPRNRR